MYDLSVIGGGPAGTAAAIAAARAGKAPGRFSPSVLVLERGRFPRQKVCGEFVSAEALGSLRQLLAPESSLLERAPRLAHARLYAPNGGASSVAIAPAAASIARWELDAALWRAAIAAGADCRHGLEVEAVRGRNGDFAVSTASGTFASRSVIDASGRWSKVNAGRLPARSQRAGRPRFIGLKAHFDSSGSSEAGSRPESENPYPGTDLYFFREGYCGVQPAAGGRLNVCAMVAPGRAARLREVFPLHPALWERSRAWTQATAQVSTAPLWFWRPQPEREGMLCAGDAAGFIDPFAGDGISLALRSALLAVQALAPFWQNLAPLGQAQFWYRQAYEKAFARAFRTAAAARLCLRAPGVLQSCLWRALRIPWLAEFLVSNTR
jgi:flavin-dependent dehydrogenase